MEMLKKRINESAKIIGSEIVKVDSFLNHQIDVNLLNEMGKEFKARFANKEVTKILTIEASGIGLACITAQYFKNVPVVFAKKLEAKNLSNDVYESQVYSFTKDKNYTIRVSKEYIDSQDKVLIIDDFLAMGNAAVGLINIVRQAQAQVVGVGIAIEKGFQKGRTKIEENEVKVESLAIIKSIDNGQIVFA